MNFQYITILVKNFKTKGPDAACDTRDKLSTILHAANQRLKTLDSIVVAERTRQEMIARVLTCTEHLLAKVNDKFKHHEMTIALFNENMVHIEQGLIQLGLDDDQEAYLVRIAEICFNKIDAILEEHEDVDHFFEALVEQLNSLVDQP